MDRPMIVPVNANEIIVLNFLNGKIWTEQCMRLMSGVVRRDGR